jgi:HEAT repeat protein
MALLGTRRVSLADQQAQRRQEEKEELERAGGALGLTKSKSQAPPRVKPVGFNRFAKQGHDSEPGTPSSKAPDSPFTPDSNSPTGAAAERQKHKAKMAKIAKDKEKAENLMRNFDAADVNLREKAAKGLNKLCKEAVLDLLPHISRRLYDTNLDVRLAVSSAFGNWGETCRPHAMAMAKKLAATDRTASKRAAMCLAAMGKVGGEVLMQQLQDENPQVRRLALEALATMSEENAAVHAKEVTDLLDDKEKAVQLQASRTLGAFGPAAAVAVPVLALGLNNVQPEMRERSAHALGCIGMAAGPIAEGLVSKLNPEFDGLTRSTATASLSLMAEEGALKLKDALSRDDRRVRVQSAQALGQMESYGAAHCEQVMAQFYDSDPILRARAVEAIGFFGERAAHLAADVAMMLYDVDSGVRRAAGKALEGVCKTKAIYSKMALWGVSWFNLEAIHHLQLQANQAKIEELQRSNLTVPEGLKTHKERLGIKLQEAFAKATNNLIPPRMVDIQMGESPDGDVDNTYIEITTYCMDDDTLQDVYEIFENLVDLERYIEEYLVKAFPFFKDLTDSGGDADVEVELDLPEYKTVTMHFDMVQQVLASAEKFARVGQRSGDTHTAMPAEKLIKVDWFMPVKPTTCTFDNKIQPVHDLYDYEDRAATQQTYYYNNETGVSSWTREGAG